MSMYNSHVCTSHVFGHVLAVINLTTWLRLESRQPKTVGLKFMISLCIVACMHRYSQLVLKENNIQYIYSYIVRFFLSIWCLLPPQGSEKWDVTSCMRRQVKWSGTWAKSLEGYIGRGVDPILPLGSDLLMNLVPSSRLDTPLFFRDVFIIVYSCFFFLTFLFCRAVFRLIHRHPSAFFHHWSQLSQMAPSQREFPHVNRRIVRWSLTKGVHFSSKWKECKKQYIKSIANSLKQCFFFQPSLWTFLVKTMFFLISQTCYELETKTTGAAMGLFFVNSKA